MGLANGIEISFFWFPNGPETTPGIASVKPDTWQTGDISTAQGAMNHLAFAVSLKDLESYREQLLAQHIFVTPILHHKADSSALRNTSKSAPYVFSLYFFDPNGILLEFADNDCESNHWVQQTAA